MDRQIYMDTAVSIWWMLSNGWIHYLELDFISMDSSNHKKKYMFLWIGINQILVILNICFQIPGVFFLHICLLLLFAICLLKMKWADVIAPFAVVLTLSTFMEGYSDLCMYWVSVSMTSAIQGRAVQFMLSLTMDLLFFGMLKLIHGKYFSAMHQSVSSYLYILLLPCGLIVLTARIGLKLDSRALEENFSAMGVSAGLASFLVMSAAAVIFLMMIHIFSIIINLSEQKTDTELLKSQLNGQKIYIEEAKKRNKEVSHFQHDIDSHLLVLSGLIHDKEYSKAEQYVNRLHIRCEDFYVPISTGNAVIDVLLKEKLNYAASSGVEISCKVKIPDNSGFDDMDLCIIFANLLDNAVRACISDSHEEGKISICAGTRAGFLMIEAVNTVSVCKPVIEGIGIANIKNVAKKYQGAVEWSDADGNFRISVLLCAPIPFTAKKMPFTL